MPFGGEFNWQDWSTYTWKELSILGAVLFLLILLFVVLPSIKAAKSRKERELVHQSTVGAKKRLVFNDAQGDSVMFAGANAWYIDANGKTELFKAVEGNEVSLTGKVIFGSKEVKKVQVTQNGDQFVKHASVERHYITFDFVSDQEVRLGHKVFLSPKEISRRLMEKRNQEVLEAKKSAKQEKIDKKNQIKEEKRAKRLEEKVDSNIVE